jgi:hypothetical protein
MARMSVDVRVTDLPEVKALIAEVKRLTTWQPIETAPTILYEDKAPDVLLYGPQLGVRTGRAARYPDGYLFAHVAHINGNLVEEALASHWMPLPTPPMAEAQESGAATEGITK